MSIFRRSSGSARRGIYSRPFPSSPSTHEEHHKSLLGKAVGVPLGFVGNLAGDIRDAAVGLPTGLAMMAQHPVKSLEEIGKTTWQDWSPLFYAGNEALHGNFHEAGHDVAKFAKQTYAHPLAPILDIASVVTLGAGSAARGGKALGELGMISKESRLAKLGHPVDVAHTGEKGTFYRHLSGNPATRMRQRATYAFGQELARTMPNWFGRRALEDGTTKSGRVFDFSPEAKYERMESRDRSMRALTADHVKAGTYAQMVKVFEGGKLHVDHPQDFYNVVEDGLKKNLDVFARPIENQFTPIDTHRVIAESKVRRSTEKIEASRARGEKGIQDAIDKNRAQLVDAERRLKEARHEWESTRPSTGAHKKRPSRLSQEAGRSSSKRAYLRSRVDKLSAEVKNLDAEKAQLDELMRGEATIESLQKHGVKIGPNTDLARGRIRALGKQFDKVNRMLEQRDKRDALAYALENEEHAGEAIARAQLDEVKAAREAAVGKVVGHTKAVQEHRENIARLERSHTDMHAAHDRLLEGAHEGTHAPYVVAPKGMRLVRRERGATPGIGKIEDVDAAIKSFANRQTFAAGRKVNPAEVLTDSKGRFLAVPDHAVNTLLEDTAQASALMKALYLRPTRIWKWMVLATRPGFLVNNVVGNLMMAMSSMGPALFTRAVLDAIATSKGTAAAAKAATAFEREAAKAAGRDGGVIHRWLMGPHQEGFGYEARAALSLGDKIGGRAGKAVSVAEGGLYGITHKVAERGLRWLAADGYLRRSPEVQRLMKNERLSFGEAADTALSTNAGLRSRIEHQVSNVLGQYHYLSPAEQSIRRLIPFYTWDRAISRHVKHMALDQPTRTAALAETGYMGVDETEKRLGEIPKFMKGSIPLSLFGVKGKGGRVPVLSTQGLNPYSTFPDIVDSARAAAVGQVKPAEAVSSQVNPLITGAIESITGQSLLTGARLPENQGGLLTSIGRNALEGTTAVKLGETLIHGAPKPKPNKQTHKTTPFLFQKDAKQQLEAFLGVPVKEVDLTRAHDMARKEQGKRKPRKSRSAPRILSGTSHSSSIFRR